MIIKNIKMEGFQSHLDSDFTLSDLLTVITGPTDAGKTAIIRALKWLAFNEPRGNDFVNAKAGAARVTLNLANGITITKERKGNQTTYTHSLIKEPFVQAEPPREVSEALGLEKIAFGEDQEQILNIAFQLDPPFLISAPGSVGAKALGKIAGTEVVDGASKAVAKDIYAARQEKQQAEREIAKLDNALKQFVGLDSLKAQLNLCERLIESIDMGISKQEKLTDLKARFDCCCQELDECIKKLDKLAVVPDLALDLENIQAAMERYARIETLYSRLNNCIACVIALAKKLDDLQVTAKVKAFLGEVESKVQKLDSLSELADKLAQVEAESEASGKILDATKELAEAEKLIEYGAALAQRVNRLEGLRDVYHAASENCASSKARLDMEKNNISKYRGQLAALQKKAGGVCPLCKREFA